VDLSAHVGEIVSHDQVVAGAVRVGQSAPNPIVGQDRVPTNGDTTLRIGIALRHVAQNEHIEVARRAEWVIVAGVG
jgi:hypothetical protein